MGAGEREGRSGEMGLSSASHPITSERLKMIVVPSAMNLFRC